MNVVRPGTPAILRFHSNCFSPAIFDGYRARQTKPKKKYGRTSMSSSVRPNGNSVKRIRKGVNLVIGLATPHHAEPQIAKREMNILL